MQIESKLMKAEVALGIMKELLGSGAKKLPSDVKRRAYRLVTQRLLLCDDVGTQLEFLDCRSENSENANIFFKSDEADKPNNLKFKSLQELHMSERSNMDSTTLANDLKDAQERGDDETVYVIRKAIMKLTADSYVNDSLRQQLSQFKAAHPQEYFDFKITEALQSNLAKRYANHFGV